MQLHTRKIDFNHEKWVFNVAMMTCKCNKDQMSIIIIINLYILVTLIRSTHERLYAICIEWTKLSEIENHSQSIQLLHAVETVSFETMYQICSRWLHIKERMF